MICFELFFLILFDFGKMERTGYSSRVEGCSLAGAFMAERKVREVSVNLYRLIPPALLFCFDGLFFFGLIFRADFWSFLCFFPMLLGACLLLPMLECRIIEFYDFILILSSRFFGRLLYALLRFIPRTLPGLPKDLHASSSGSTLFSSVKTSSPRMLASILVWGF